MLRIFTQPITVSWTTDDGSSQGSASGIVIDPEGGPVKDQIIAAIQTIAGPTNAEAIAFAVDPDMQVEAKQRASAVPGWAAITQAEALDWIDEHLDTPTEALLADHLALQTAVTAVTNIATAKSAMQAQGNITNDMRQILLAQNQAITLLARMVLALRDYVLPDLEASE